MTCKCAVKDEIIRTLEDELVRCKSEILELKNQRRTSIVAAATDLEELVKEFGYAFGRRLISREAKASA